MKVKITLKVDDKNKQKIIKDKLLEKMLNKIKSKK